MKSDGLFDPIYGQLERVLDLRAEQHNLLSANLANASTPNYRAKEIDFSQILEDVMDQPTATMRMASSVPGHLGGLTGTRSAPELTIHEPPPWALDGNSVNSELELVKVMENTVNFNAVTRTMSKKLAMLKAAVSER